MKNERHLVVQEPDGTIAIAFNSEVSPPEPQVQQEVQHVQRVFRIRYNLFTKLYACFLLTLAVFQLLFFSHPLDAINLLFMSVTTIVIYSEKPHSIIQLTVHGFTSIIWFLILSIIQSWYRAAYQLSCFILCLYAQLSSEADFE